jgi:hypothetical protein
MEDLGVLPACDFEDVKPKGSFGGGSSVPVVVLNKSMGLGVSRACVKGLEGNVFHR